MAGIKDKYGNNAVLNKSRKNSLGDFSIEINGRASGGYLTEIYIESGYIVGVTGSGNKYKYNASSKVASGRNIWRYIGKANVTTKQTTGSKTIIATPITKAKIPLLEQLSGSIQIGKSSEIYKIVFAILGAGVLVALAFFGGIFGKKRKRRR